MGTIYIVTSGDYSDYGIEAVFTDRKIAEEWIAKKTNDTGRCFGDELEIEEWEDMAEKEKWLYTVYISVHSLKLGSFSNEGDGYICHYSDPNCGYIIVASDSEERAIKVAAERWTRHRLNNRKA